MQEVAHDPVASRPVAGGAGQVVAANLAGAGSRLPAYRALPHHGLGMACEFRRFRTARHRDQRLRHSTKGLGPPTESGTGCTTTRCGEATSTEYLLAAPCRMRPTIFPSGSPNSTRCHDNARRLEQRRQRGLHLLRCGRVSAPRGRGVAGAAAAGCSGARSRSSRPRSRPRESAAPSCPSFTPLAACARRPSCGLPADRARVHFGLAVTSGNQRWRLIWLAQERARVGRQELHAAITLLSRQGDRPTIPVVIESTLACRPLSCSSRLAPGPGEGQ